MVRETTMASNTIDRRPSRLSSISNQVKFKLDTTFATQITKNTKNSRKKLGQQNLNLDIATTTTQAIKSIDNAKFDAKKDTFLLKLCLMNARLKLFKKKEPSVKKSTKVPAKFPG